MSDSVDQAAIKKWVAQLASEVSTERLEALSGLANLALRTRPRGAARTRGTISQAASARLPGVPFLSSIQTAFEDNHLEVRRSLAFTLGELGNETAVAILSRLAQSDSESVVRAEAVEALGKIGGLPAMEVIKAVAGSDSSVAVRSRAVGALLALASAEPEASRNVVESLKAFAAQEHSEVVSGQIERALTKLD